MTDIEIPFAVAEQVASWRRVFGHCQDGGGKARELLRNAAADLWNTLEINRSVHPKAQDVSRQEIVDALHDMAAGVGIPDADAQLIFAESFKARTNGGDREKKRQEKQQSGNVTGVPLTYFRDCNQDTQKRWSIKGVIAEGETSTWIAPPGGGKSATITDLAVHYAYSDFWRGFRVKERGGVVYFAFERADLTKRRLYAYRLRDNLPVNLPIAVSGQIIDLLDPRCVDLIIPTLKQAEQDFGLPVRIAVFDTYNKGIAIGGGDEDKAKDQNRALGNLRRIQEQYSRIHVAAVGHTGKDETRGARGSNALLGDADMQNQFDASGEIKIINTTKANDAPIGELLRFKLEPYVFGNDEDGDPISVHILARDIIPTQAFAPKKTGKAPKMRRGARDMRDSIIEVLDGHAVKVQIANGQTVKAAGLEKVQAEFSKRYVLGDDDQDGEDNERKKKDRVRKAFDRELERLPEEYIARVINDRQWIYRVKD